MVESVKSIPNHLLDVKRYNDKGYSPLIDYNSWRVAILNYIDELDIQNITKFEKHNETDEVFVLLKGKFILFIGDKLDSEDGEIFGIKLEPLKLYNVKKGVWHNHTLSKDASVLIIENQNTCFENSTSLNLLPKYKKKMIQIAKQF